MNIRHNNLNPESNKYSPVFADFSLKEKEEYYDLIYEQALFLYMLLGQEQRDETIKEYKLKNAK